MSCVKTRHLHLPEQELCVFEYSLSFVYRVFGQSKLPGDANARVGTLNVFGVLNGSWTGYKYRCRSPGHEAILTNISDHLERTGYRRRFGISGINVPSGGPFFQPRMFDKDLYRKPFPSNEAYRRLIR